MRIIKVTGCHDCPYARFSISDKDFYCAKNPPRRIDSYIDANILHYNCPLEEVVQIITKARVEEVHGSAK